MDGVQLFQGYSLYEKTVYFLPSSAKEVLALIYSTSKRWKAESTLEWTRWFWTQDLWIVNLAP